jgi:hypothetical protein
MRFLTYLYSNFSTGHCFISSPQNVSCRLGSPCIRVVRSSYFKRITDCNYSVYVMLCYADELIRIRMYIYNKPASTVSSTVVSAINLTNAKLKWSLRSITFAHVNIDNISITELRQFKVINDQMNNTSINVDGVVRSECVSLLCKLLAQNHMWVSCGAERVACYGLH